MQSRFQPREAAAMGGGLCLLATMYFQYYLFHVSDEYANHTQDVINTTNADPHRRKARKIVKSEIVANWSLPPLDFVDKCQPLGDCPAGKVRFRGHDTSNQEILLTGGFSVVGLGRFLDTILCQRELCTKRSWQKDLEIYTGEFGYEIQMELPKTYGMCQKGDLGNTSSLPGMEPWYFFNLGRHSVHEAGARSYTTELDSPHVGPWRIPHDKGTWVPPPYQCAFQGSWLRTDKPILVIQNKYNTEWRGQPRNYYSPTALYRLFHLFKGRMQIIYIRTTKRLFGIEVHDASTTLQTPDFDMINLAFPEVITMDLLLQTTIDNMRDSEVIPRATLVNTLIMGVMAAARRIITLQGGDAAISMYFCHENLMFINKGVAQAQELRSGDMNWWPWLTTKQAPNYRKCQLQTFMQVSPLLSYVQGMVSGFATAMTDVHAKRCPYCITRQLDGLPDCPCTRWDQKPYEPDAPQRAAMRWLRSRSVLRGACASGCWPGTGIDNIYVVSVPDRLPHMRSVVGAMGGQATFVEAVDALFVEQLIKTGGQSWLLIDAKKALDVMFDFKPASFKKTSRKIACQLSHLTALSHFVTQKDSRLALIMEDDLGLEIEGAKLVDTVRTLIENVTRHIEAKKPKDQVHLGVLPTTPDEGFDAIYLGYCYEPIDSQAYADHYHGVQPLIHPFCRHAYVMTKTGAHKILDTGLPVQSTGDWMHARMVASGQLRVYGPLNGSSMFVQNRKAFGSNLGNQVAAAPPGFRPRKAYGDVRLSAQEVVEQLQRIRSK
eukprot:TRINITY_DN24134_c0_g1_i1.p1 TRINITY_DN24134_c0_g1~~TRINITY_DN24134_c0_g1_i1.p1  ORF type:complete len:773 (-),score=84.79 TRINITY_DN24134_c0_g1_i1:75-2393(-)